MRELKVDSIDYHVLVDAVHLIKGVPGLTLEIGLREGGGSKFIINALLENEDFGRTHIAIDPYGTIGYRLSDLDTVQYEFSNEFMKETISSFYDSIIGQDVHFLFFPVEDIEYFKMFKDGVPVYKDGDKIIINAYALVHFDGPHNTGSVQAETWFFSDRASVGAVFVYDDVTGHYDHTSIEQYLLRRGWVPKFGTSKKIAYQKVK